MQNAESRSVQNAVLRSLQNADPGSLQNPRQRSLQKAQYDLYKNVKNGQHLSLIDNGHCPFYLLMDFLHHPGLDDHDNKRDYI